jgi:hypothetical protein
LKVVFASVRDGGSPTKLSSSRRRGFLLERSRPPPQNFGRKHMGMGGGTQFVEHVRQAPFPYMRPEAHALEGFPGLVNNSYTR